jgi:hypothetical protein
LNRPVGAGAPIRTAVLGEEACGKGTPVIRIIGDPGGDVSRAVASRRARGRRRPTAPAAWLRPGRLSPLTTRGDAAVPGGPCCLGHDRRQLPFGLTSGSPNWSYDTDAPVEFTAYAFGGGVRVVLASSHVEWLVALPVTQKFSLYNAPRDLIAQLKSSTSSNGPTLRSGRVHDPRAPTRAPMLSPFGEPQVVYLFLGFLLAVIVIAASRTACLAWWTFSPWSRRVSIDGLRAGTIAPDDAARLALRGKVGDLPAAAASRPGAADACRALRAADARFNLLWDDAAAMLAANRGLLWVTLLVSVLSFVYGFIPAYNNEIDNTNRLPHQALYLSTMLLTFRLSLGLLVCVVMAVATMTFDGVLRRRRARWRFVYATASDDWGGQSGPPSSTLDHTNAAGSA